MVSVQLVQAATPVPALPATGVVLLALLLLVTGRDAGRLGPCAIEVAELAAPELPDLEQARLHLTREV
ncbi:MAG: hypothetical protein F4137_10245 [Acidobacteria bacterium]|nr:hypothetical protein [Acidobacteriota bacterium]MYH29216.1 hypothetical protein [Acidobacteriota bacterium]